MRYFFVVLLLAVGVLSGFGCESKSSTSSGKSTTGSELLLLDDEPGNENGDLSEGVDNSRCHVCHMDFAKEEIAVKHGRAGIGCSKCHGESDEHIADESWAMGGKGTAPDVMFRRSQSIESCMECHPKEKITGEEQHKPFLEGTVDKVCTDCHGIHGILPSSDSRSTVYHINVPETCGSCHSDTSYFRFCWEVP